MTPHRAVSIEQLLAYKALCTMPTHKAYSIHGGSYDYQDIRTSVSSTLLLLKQFQKRILIYAIAWGLFTKQQSYTHKSVKIFPEKVTRCLSPPVAASGRKAPTKQLKTMYCTLGANP